MEHRAIATATILLLIGGLSTACGDGSGSCVGTGGVLLSPTCNQGWTQDECADWQSQGVNGATWTFSNSSCIDQGYTANCSPNVYRLPGAC